MVAFLQAFVPIQLDRAVVDEYIWPAIPPQKPIAFCVIEPLHYALIQSSCLLNSDHIGLMARRGETFWRTYWMPVSSATSVVRTLQTFCPVPGIEVGIICRAPNEAAVLPGSSRRQHFQELHGRQSSLFPDGIRSSRPFVVRLQRGQPWCDVPRASLPKTLA